MPNFTTLARRFSALVCAFWLPLGAANEVMRPTRPEQLLLGTKVDRAYRVKTARVAAFNRPALERDFPRLRGRPDAAIEAWILKHFAYLNARQLALVGIRNTPVDFDPNDWIRLYVPPGVGRGGVVHVPGEGLVDVKANGNSSWNEELVNELVAEAKRSAAGLLKVREKDHSNGLETYGLAVAEYLRQLEIQADYNRRNADPNFAPMETVESYFLIDWGFKLIYPNAEIEAFGYGRQAQLGRTADNRPLKDEIYVDKGEFQESYSGTRIDFGGSRTRAEAARAYHDHAATLRPEQMREFIANESRRFGDAVSRRTFAPVPAAQMREALAVRASRYERGPNPSAIGKSRFDMPEHWRVDVAVIAQLKWTLWQMSDAELREFLTASSDDALMNLFGLASATFQIPLPRIAYEVGIARGGVAGDAALVAAIRVFDRYPELVERVVQASLAGLAVAEYWAPNSVFALIDVEHEFKGYEAFLKRVLQSSNAAVKVMVIERIRNKYRGRPRARRLIKFMVETQTDPDVLRSMRRRLGVPKASCEARLSR